MHLKVRQALKQQIIFHRRQEVGFNHNSAIFKKFRPIGDLPAVCGNRDASQYRPREVLAGSDR